MPQITAFLFHAGGDDDPATLAANGDRSFAGSFILGMGFTFDDTDTKGVASPISMMHGLIAKDPRNAERIFPYIGGEEVNDSPSHAHHRYVINFEISRCAETISERAGRKLISASARFGSAAASFRWTTLSPWQPIGLVSSPYSRRRSDRFAPQTIARSGVVIGGISPSERRHSMLQSRH